jgi:predicted ribosomally synthesized peptide with SipW-like signal peptide
MTKRLILSLAMVAVTLSGVTAATFAYFSSGQVLGSNTFQTGNVNLGGFNYANLQVTGLAPGVPVIVPDVAINYTGTLNADLYMGARGTGATAYLADKLYLRVYIHNTNTVAWEGHVNALSSGWGNIALNTSAGWKEYDLQFTLDNDAGNDKQGQTNTDTQIMVFAVQAGKGVPALTPQQTWNNVGGTWTDVAGWFNL